MFFLAGNYIFTNSCDILLDLDVLLESVFLSGPNKDDREVVMAFQLWRSDFLI